MTNNCPETPEDWWTLLDAHWMDLYDILNMFLRMENPAYKEPGKADSGLAQRKGMATVSQAYVVQEARENRDHETLLRYLNGAWFAAPDRPEIHDIPGWGILCNLCSENWVFDPDHPVYS